MDMPDQAGARIIVTGGTFDKRYDAIKGELTFKETHLPAILEQARVSLPLALDIRLLIDSLQMTDAHRQDVLAACRESPERARRKAAMTSPSHAALMALVCSSSTCAGLRPSTFRARPS